jgi:hypothetical protein
MGSAHEVTESAPAALDARGREPPMAAVRRQAAPRVIPWSPRQRGAPPRFLY